VRNAGKSFISLSFSSLSFGLVRFIYGIFIFENPENEKPVPKVGPGKYACMLSECQKSA
jgi:hypothetical protein